MSGARHREEGLLRGRTAIYQFHQRLFRLVAGIVRALGGVIAWVIIWYFLTFLGVMIGSMADHYERATDETNDSPYSNTYDAAPANPGEYYDPNEQQ